MKTISLLGVLLVAVFCMQLPNARAEYGPEEKQIGVGVYMGEPMGLTGKFYLAEKTALQGVAAWSFFDEAFTVIGDFLFNVHDLAESSSDYSMPVYVGVGAKFVAENSNANNDSTFGLHVPIGIAWQSTDAPIEIAFEIAPGLHLAPESKFDINGGIAFRYYF